MLHLYTVLLDCHTWCLAVNGLSHCLTLWSWSDTILARCLSLLFLFFCLFSAVCWQITHSSPQTCISLSMLTPFYPAETQTSTHRHMHALHSIIFSGFVHLLTRQSWKLQITLNLREKVCFWSFFIFKPENDIFISLKLDSWFDTPRYTVVNTHTCTHANNTVNQGEVRDIFMLIHISLKLKKRTKRESNWRRNEPIQTNEF